MIDQINVTMNGHYALLAPKYAMMFVLTTSSRCGREAKDNIQLKANNTNQILEGPKLATFHSKYKEQ